MAYRTYTVDIVVAGETDHLDVVARNANEAKKRAREYMRDHCGHNWRYDGPVKYRARSHRDG